MSRKSRAGAFMSGALFGSLIGAAVALLYTPQTGEETRTVIKEKSIELRDRAVESSEELRTRAEEAASLTRERANELQQRGLEFFDQQAERVRSAIEAGKQSLAQKEETPETNGAEKAKSEA